jgi:hypothetical protein
MNEERTGQGALGPAAEVRRRGAVGLGIGENAAVEGDSLR